MEVLLNALGEILINLNTNLWLSITIFVLLIPRDTRVAGFLLLVMQVAFGYNVCIFLLVSFLAICTWYLYPRKLYEDKYEHKINEIKRRLTFEYNMREDDINNILR